MKKYSSEMHQYELEDPVEHPILIHTNLLQSKMIPLEQGIEEGHHSNQECCEEDTL